MPLLLSESDIRSVLSMDDLIESMTRTLAGFSAGRARQPIRTVVEAGPHHAFYGVMPAFIEDPPSLGTKLVSVFGSNAARGLPTHLATIVLVDPETGELQAVMDGRYITEARTAAVSAASAKPLARTEARILAVFGSGVQARSHLDALMRVRDFDRVRVWSRDPNHVRALIEAMANRIRVPMEAASTPEGAAEGADVIVLATASREPVLTRGMVRDGTHICAVGACRPDQREMDTALVRDARLFVDSRPGALAEAGDILLPIREGAIDASHIAGELGEVFAGGTRGRQDDREITVFKSLGMAVEDVAAARLAYDRASERGLGRGFVI